MARRPTSDERSVLPPPSNAPIQERFFLIEIARFLRCPIRHLAKLLRREGLLRRLYLRHRGHVFFTTERGVQIAIVHFRAKQAERFDAPRRRRCSS